MKRVISFMALALLVAMSFTLAACDDSVRVGDDTATFVSDDFDEEWGLTIEVKLKIIGGDDDVLYSGTVEISSMNPVGLEALIGATEEKGINLDESGGFINSIGGYTNDFGEMIYWRFYVNGETAHLGAGTFQVREGDLIEFRYEAQD